MRGTRTSLSRTNTALCRDLVVHVEGDKLVFLCSCCNLEAEWEVTLCLLSCRIMQLWISISPEVPQPKGAGIGVTVNSSNIKKDPPNLHPPGKCSIPHSPHVASLLGRVPGAGPILHVMALDCVRCSSAGQGWWISWSSTVLQALTPSLHRPLSQSPYTHRPWSQTDLVWILALLMAPWPWTNHLPSLSFSFLFCKYETVTPNFQDFYVN